jgi:hypothetical protein
VISWFPKFAAFQMQRMLCRYAEGDSSRRPAAWTPWMSTYRGEAPGMRSLADIEMQWFKGGAVQVESI